jgi:hypothetical protein
MVSVYAPSFPPTWQVPTPVLQRRTTSPAGAIRAVTWQYDPLARDVVVDGNGQTPLTTAQEAAIFWAAKAVTTQRGAHIIYARSFGADIRRSLRAGSHPQVEAALTAEMRRAVKRDVRIRDLDSFQFYWQSNILRVAYRCLLADGASKRTTIGIPLA